MDRSGRCRCTLGRREEERGRAPWRALEALPTRAALFVAGSSVDATTATPPAASRSQAEYSSGLRLRSLLAAGGAISKRTPESAVSNRRPGSDRAHTFPIGLDLSSTAAEAGGGGRGASCREEGELQTEGGHGGGHEGWRSRGHEESGAS